MWVISMKKENKWIVAVVCAVVAAALVVALVLLLPGQGEDQPQVSMPTGDVTEPSDPGNVTEPSDTAGAGTEEPGADHVHTWTETVTAPGCVEGGYTTYTCACGESYTDNETQALGHDWADATCTSPKTCRRCQITDGREKGHAWDGGQVIREATEEEDGEKRFTCTVCQDTKTQLIPSKKHQHSYADVKTVQPTCTEGGYTVHTCACGDSYTDGQTPAVGHGWKAATCTSPKICTVCGTTDGGIPGHSWQEATCTEGKTCTVCGTVGGSKLGHDWADATCKDPRICKRCEATEGKALGHNYNSVVTEPTKTEQGYTTHTCTRCGDSYVDNYTNLDGVQYDPGTLLFCTDGQALLYGENGKVSKTYTGWVTGSYGAYYTQEPPWYQDRLSIRKAIIQDGISLKDIEAWFRGCQNLEEVKLGDGVKLIGDYAFYECYKLRSVEIPAGVTGIGTYAFNGCDSLKSIRIPAGVTKLGMFVFSGCIGLTTVEFDKESQLTSMESFAFSNCSSLAAIHIPASVTSIGDRALSGCSALAAITAAPENTVYQGQGNCLIHTASKTLIVGCKSSVIPVDGSVTALGAGSFSNCDSLTRIHIPATITKIDADALSACDNLVTITVDEQNPVYMAKGNCLIRKADSTLVTACKGSVIPSDGSVTHIGSGAFTDDNLTAIHIPANITHIDDRAFYYCAGLTTVTFADGSRLVSIGNEAFSDCRKLTDLVIPSSVTHIGDNAFDSCYGIKSVTFGENSRLVSIGHYAFGNCAYLESVIFRGTVAQWNAVSKGTQWCDATLATEVVCTDGNVTI